MNFFLITLFALSGFISGKAGLWGDDQPFDPNNPINPVARKIASVLGGITGGILSQKFIGADNIGVALFSAILFGFTINEIIRSFHKVGSKK